MSCAPERVVLVALAGYEHLVGGDDEPHMLDAQNDGVVAHQQLARLCSQQAAAPTLFKATGTGWAAAAQLGFSAVAVQRWQAAG